MDGYISFNQQQPGFPLLFTIILEAAGSSMQRGDDVSVGQEAQEHRYGFDMQPVLRVETVQTKLQPLLHKVVRQHLQRILHL